jgi:lipopolysaccharide transport system permease protein
MAKNNTLIIKPGSSRLGVYYFTQLLNYKDLFLELTLRDLKVRYKQTVLGVVWVILQPLLPTLIFTILFGIILKLPSDDMPYPLFVFVGLTFWNFFSTSVVSSSGSLTGNEALIKKVFFPRILLPLSLIATNLIDFCISVLFMVVLMVYYKFFPHPLIFVALPLTIILMLLITSGLSFYLSALNVKYRDVKQVIPPIIQILIFLTPVIYPVSLISGSKQWILALNPLTSAIEINRALLSGSLDYPIIFLLISFVIAIIVFVFGLLYFKATENSFADLI